MAKYVHNDVPSGYSTTQINEELEKIELAINDQLDRKGGAGNQLQADLDLNSNDILNGGSITADTLVLGGQTVVKSGTVDVINGTPYATLSAAQADTDLLVGSVGYVVGLGAFRVVSTNPDSYFVASVNGFIEPLGEVHVKMFGVTEGGVTDTTTSLSNAFNAPNRVFAEEGEQYLITSPIVGPSNKRISFNGAKILMGATVTSSSPILSLGTNCTAKDLEIEVQTGFTVNRGFVAGTNSFVKNVKVTSVDQQANTGLTNHAAVRLVGDNIIGENITVSNWDQQILLSGDKITFNGKSNSYVRGLYADVCDNLTVENYHAETASANATTDPGHNGILLSEVRYSNISNYTIEDAGEHGVRIGGGTTNPSRDITFSNGQVIRPGQCGFKAFSSTDRTANITINGLNVVDCSFGGASSSNEDGLRLQNVDGCHVSGFRVSKKDNAGAGCFNGIYISGCTDITVSSPQIQNSSSHGIALDDTDGLSSQINISSPFIKSAGGDSVNISSPTQPLRDVYITDIKSMSQTGYAVNLDAGGTILAPVVLSGQAEPTGSGIYNGNSNDDQLVVDVRSTQPLLATSELTISSGAVTLDTRTRVQTIFVDTEADAATDDLDTISQGSFGDILVVRPANPSRTVVLKDGTGNLRLSGDITLDNTDDTATLVSGGTNWFLITSSDNGA